MSELPTIRIKSGDSFANINESDFDPALHERYVDPDAPPAVPDGAKTPAEVLAMFGDDDTHFMTAKAEAAKLLGDATPSTKAEIIEALQKL